jgi:hypothetical protein
VAATVRWRRIAWHFGCTRGGHGADDEPAEDHCTLDTATELTDVAWPVVRQEPLFGLVADGLVRIDCASEVISQRENVLATLA